ncbi:enoyl-[acyl-carrier-protein] reductase FabK [Mobilitalea sibirica]|uniref:Probable nitronate monooxygenase n=1 Tax=Mobilitalea sibirica TaxID=1462919 RepID=A0A8J7H5D6_9FIRM|nr:enoyl-[acyl-carrier-protein] reductase FabK [Mobilitalea sibirica]MBH1940066.1 enoyl-[acyl-carrier-protein] reductase FabK [Mobilitalea sibirica]
MKSRVCELLNIEYPVFQGAMARISDASLAAAVSEAGGLGIIAGGTAPVDYVRGEVRKAKALTNKPFGVNIMLLSEFADEIAHMVCEEGVKVVTTGAGAPGKYMEMWKAHGIKVIPVVPSVAIAKRMVRSGADAVIAEGTESGGHVGELTTMVLVPQVVDAVGADVPVIAAGGIGDGRGVAAAFMLGADAVQVGTRFLIANECTVHPNYKQKVLNAKDIDTVVTGRCTGHPVRIFKNKLSRQFLELESKAAPVDEIEKLGVGALARAAAEGDMDYGSVMAGQIAAIIKKEQSCKEIITEMIEEAEKLLCREWR